MLQYIPINMNTVLLFQIVNLPIFHSAVSLALWRYCVAVNEVTIQEGYGKIDQYLITRKTQQCLHNSCYVIFVSVMAWNDIYLMYTHVSLDSEHARHMSDMDTNHTLSDTL